MIIAIVKDIMIDIPMKLHHLDKANVKFKIITIIAVIILIFKL